LGGTIAFEIARQLEAEGHQVELVALLDAYDFGVQPKVLLSCQKFAQHRIEKMAKLFRQQIPGDSKW